MTINEFVTKLALARITAMSPLSYSYSEDEKRRWHNCLQNHIESAFEEVEDLLGIEIRSELADEKSLTRQTKSIDL